MTESSAPRPGPWRYGLHPRAAGLQLRSLGRVDLPLGEALRIEMVDAGTGGSEIVHLQYYISTDLGPWALWISCARADLAQDEAGLQEIVPPFAGDAAG
jgi:hypothetical protein